MNCPMEESLISWFTRELARRFEPPFVHISTSGCTKSQISRNSAKTAIEYWPWISCNPMLSGSASWTVILLYCCPWRY
jgi:hypothetical protein